MFIFDFLQYVVIFGFPAFFARLDNMDPPAPAICIARVQLYSKMWRTFDKGLYDFFKTYIFVPICRPTFSLWRKIFGLAMSYVFVLIWHSMDRAHVVWVVLNCSEILIETIAKIIYVQFLKEKREKYISDQNFRRILAWLQIFPLCFGLYGTFYFVGGATGGWIFVDRIFWGKTVTLKWQFFVLITIGYNFTNVCMEIERWEKRKGENQQQEHDI